MKRIPVTIIGGYLGAGKTTLINRLLCEDHGLAIAVIVNDFGAINIDAELIENADGQTIALTNGCVCCSMGNDLAFALHQIAARETRPSHIIIEASGVSDPVGIANTVLNENALSYAGIITLVDGQNGSDLLRDEMLAPQVSQQIVAADLVLVSKIDALHKELSELLQEIGARTPTLIEDVSLAPLIFDIAALPKGRASSTHLGYTTWHHQSNVALDRRALGDKLAARPEGLYRMKGSVLTSRGAYELHVVGRHVDARPSQATETQLVALGPMGRISVKQIEDWWHS